MAYHVHFQSSFGGSENWSNAKVVHNPKRFHESKYGDAFTEVVYVTFHNRYDKHQAYRASKEIFGTHCQHEYDCCGNWYCSVAYGVKKTKGRTYRVVLRWRRNV